MSASEIVPHIWISNSKVAASKKFLLEKKILTIINCTDQDPFPACGDGVEKIRLPTPAFQKNTAQRILRVLQNISYSYKNLRPILLYCKDGVQYSPTIMCIFIIKYTKCDYKSAIQLLKSKRPNAFKNKIEYLSLLENFDKYYPTGQCDEL